jgi:hypothetical protein
MEWAFRWSFEMARGLSKAQEQGYRYRMLKKLERELKASGVACWYVRGGRLSGNGLFDILIHRMNASNGECCLYPMLYRLGQPACGLGKQESFESGFNALKNGE